MKLNWNQNKLVITFWKTRIPSLNFHLMCQDLRECTSTFINYYGKNFWKMNWVVLLSIWYAYIPYAGAWYVGRHRGWQLLLVTLNLKACGEGPRNMLMHHLVFSIVGSNKQAGSRNPCWSCRGKPIQCIPNTSISLTSIFRSQAWPFISPKFSPVEYNGEPHWLKAYLPVIRKFRLQSYNF